MNFEWNKDKAEKSKRKHGVSFDEALTVFQDALSFTYPDADHSIGEERYLIIGLSASNNILVISHIFRDEKIRIISARKATKKERYFYESTTRH